MSKFCIALAALSVFLVAGVQPAHALCVPAEYTYSEWSACSATCGEGVETRQLLISWAGQIYPADSYPGYGCGVYGDNTQPLAQACDTEVPCFVDTDGDTIDDSVDLCAGTLSGAVVDAQGCSGRQIIAQACTGKFDNHGRTVACVVHKANLLVTQLLLTKEERNLIVNEAAKK